MNCTVWTCEHCGNQNSILDDRCIQCNQAYGSHKTEMQPCPHVGDSGGCDDCKLNLEPMTCEEEARA